MQLAGPNASDFKLTNDCNEPSYTQNTGCTLSVAFTPSAAGSRFAQILISDNASTPAPTINLSGVTATEAVTISPGSSQGMSETVSAGETAAYTFNIVSTFNGTISFSPCSGAPTTATCTVPSPISVTANQTTPFSITVATVATSSMSRLEGPRMFRPARELFAARFEQAPALLPIAFMFLLLSAFSLRRALHLETIIENARAFPLPASAIVITLLALAPFVIAGCGGASTIATAPTTTRRPPTLRLTPSSSLRPPRHPTISPFQASSPLT
jgi:hypothetical protein